ncbi:asparaginase domain-containing protein (plasmid) [Aggregatilineales bacterium SYSU G02658]
MIHLFTTGGSIDKAYSTAASDFLVSEPQAAHLLREANVNFDYTITELLRKDSLALTDDDRAQIVQAVRRSPWRQIVITHGTDTMPQTAEALAAIRGKTIVLTGAMQPAAFKSSDAAFNLGTAIAAVQILPAGVYIAMSGLILPAAQARKNHATNQYERVEPA